MQLQIGGWPNGGATEGGGAAGDEARRQGDKPDRRRYLNIYDQVLNMLEQHRKRV